MTQKELTENEKFLEALKINKAELMRVQKELLRIPEVKEYLRVSSQIENLEDKMTGLNQTIISEKQKICPHDFWYMISDNIKWNNETWWKCKCLSCGKEETRLQTDFEKETIVSCNITYDSTAHIYREETKNNVGTEKILEKIKQANY